MGAIRRIIYTAEQLFWFLNVCILNAKLRDITFATSTVYTLKIDTIESRAINKIQMYIHINRKG